MIGDPSVYCDACASPSKQETCSKPPLNVIALIPKDSIDDGVANSKMSLKFDSSTIDSNNSKPAYVNVLALLLQIYSSSSHGVLVCGVLRIERQRNRAPSRSLRKSQLEFGRSTHADPSRLVDSVKRG